MMTPPQDDTNYKPNYLGLLVPCSEVEPDPISDDEQTDSTDKKTMVNTATDQTSDVVTVTRCYGTSGLDPTCAVWLDADSLSEVAVVEYKGVKPDAIVYGNAMSTKRPYVRRPAATMDKVAAAVMIAPPKSVYADYLMEMLPTTAPCSSRAVRDKRHKELQKQRQHTQTIHRLNFADEILQVDIL